MKNLQKIYEIKGIPGQVVGGLILPNLGGTVSLQISKRILREKVRIGSEKQETFTPIDRIDRIGVCDTSIGIFLVAAAVFFLLGFSSVTSRGKFGGFALVCFLFAALLALAYFFAKYRYLIVTSGRNTLVVFMNQPQYAYRQFALTLAERREMIVSGGEAQHAIADLQTQIPSVSPGEGQKKT